MTCDNVTCSGGDRQADHRVGDVTGSVPQAQVQAVSPVPRHGHHLLAGGRLHLPRQPPVRGQQLRRGRGRRDGDARGQGP